MYLLIFFIILIFTFILLFFIKLANVTFDYNTDRDELSINTSWLKNFISIQFQKRGNCRKLFIYLFKKHIVTKTLNAKKGYSKNQVQHFHALSLEQAHCNMFYGFSSPFFTGVSNSLFPLIQSIVPNVLFEMLPDFLSDHEYLIIKAETKLNLGKTLINLIRNRPDKRSEKNYGSIEYV